MADQSMTRGNFPWTAVMRASVLVLLLGVVPACQSGRIVMDSKSLKDFGAQYTAAWCSQNAASVASFFATQGSLQINDGPPSAGRDAIAKSAQGFMTAFPDLVVRMDGIETSGADLIYRWTLTGTNTGPGGTGRSVRINGFERWRFGSDGLIAESKGHFDAADYQRQLNATGSNP